MATGDYIPKPTRFTGKISEPIWTEEQRLMNRIMRRLDDVDRAYLLLKYSGELVCECNGINEVCDKCI